MKAQQQQDSTFQIRIPEELKDRYKKYCNEEGLTPSKRIRIFIEKELGDRK